jgi:hypothetical protein
MTDAPVAVISAADPAPAPLILPTRPARRQSGEPLIRLRQWRSAGTMAGRLRALGIPSGDTTPLSEN